MRPAEMVRILARHKCGRSIAAGQLSHGSATRPMAASFALDVRSVRATEYALGTLALREWVSLCISVSQCEL